MLRIAKTENGLVRGLPGSDREVTVFRGVPFAAPPVGDLRWRAPQPAADWEGVRDCYEFPPICPQQIAGVDFDNMYVKEFWVDNEIPMNEDCLYVNIWTPAKKPDEKLPVMIWIHGGGFACGFNSEMEFDGERIARRGCILVNIAYRVAYFGFMAHPEITKEAGADGAVANFGLYDQKFAIEWVKRNIAGFGGDPENLTIFGQSAGGMSVFAHMVTPLEDEHLFQKAICHSGGGLSVGMMDIDGSIEDAEKDGIDFFKVIGASNLAEARKIDAEVIRKAGLGRNIGVCADGRFLPAATSKLIIDGKCKPVISMCGHTSEEFGFMMDWCDSLEAVEGTAREMLGDKADEVLKAVDFASGDLELIKKNARTNMSRFGAKLFAMYAGETGRKNYMYNFDVPMPGDNEGVFHSADLWFAFETLANSWRPFTGAHYETADKMCSYWTNFAKTGDPNGVDHKGEALPHWDAYTPETPNAMRIALDTGMEQNPDSEGVEAIYKACAELMWRK